MYFSRKKSLRNSTGWMITLLIIIQLIPLDRKNPPETAPLAINNPALQGLEKSCYTCHSVKTRWPRASWIAPVSWIMTAAVHNGRDRLNFSTWQSYTNAEKQQLLNDISPIVSGKKQHAKNLRMLYPQRALTTTQRRALLMWIEGEQQHDQN